MLALVSGAVSTSLGSVLWYAAVRRMRATSAASIQLVVPVLAYLGGTLLLAEVPSVATMLAALIVLAGVALCVRRAGVPTVGSVRATRRSGG
jgi:drug/metabolite transporter (DMT)-like permease